jgi:hypothetical protein
MALRVGSLMVAALAVLSGDVTAQETVQSFDQLPAAVRRGTAIVVDLEDGRSITAKVVSVSGDRLELRRRRWNFRSERLVFSAPVVRRIEQRDSTANGTLIGIGAGALAAWVKCRTSGPAYGVDVGCIGWSFFAPAVGGVAGHVIDASHRRALYSAPASRIQVAPARGLGIGVAATVAF